MVKKGDTLVEVALAIGIFSMVAIAIVSIISSSTAGTQTALETTLVREEIDIQAEALRFIQGDYVASKGESNSKVDELWQTIKGLAIDFKKPPYNTLSPDNVAKILNYNPTTCQNMLTDLDNVHSNLSKRAFIINPRALGELSNSDAGIDDILIVNNASNSSVFKAPTTYSRLVYKNSANALVGGADTDNELDSAEGLYVLAVKDDGTSLADEGGVKEVEAYYDFYIRACWYGTNADEPSTVSTIIRLYDPDSVPAL